MYFSFVIGVSIGTYHISSKFLNLIVIGVSISTYHISSKFLVDYGFLFLIVCFSGPCLGRLEGFRCFNPYCLLVVGSSCGYQPWV